MQWFDKLTIRRNTIIGGAIFIVTFAIYIFTMCPTIYWEDSAAFSAVNSILGIPHPPGFPIYVLLGRGFSLLPIENHAFRSNLMSAFWGCVSLMILYLLMLQLFKEIKSCDDAFGRGLSPTRKKWISQMGMVVGVLFFAFSSAFWLQTIRAEVYTLNLFLTLLLIFLLIKWSQKKDANFSFKILILFSFVLGLSFTNHPLLVIALLPTFLVFLFIHSFRWGRGLTPAPTGELKKIIILLAFFILGISLYLFLPIRSQLSPAINWGRPDSVANLFSYITRSSQSTSVAASSVVPYLSRFWFTLSFPVIQFSLPLFWLGVLGAYSMFKKSRRLFMFTFLLFIFNLFTATWATDFSLRNYDLLGYLLPSLSIFAIWFAMGIFFFTESILKVGRVSRRRRDTRQNQCQVALPLKRDRKPTYIFKVSFCGLILSLPIFQIARNFDQCNKRSTSWAYQYADRILNSVKKNALILVGDDNTLTTLWYLNYAEKKRPDVKIVSRSAFTQKSHRDQLQKQYKQVSLPKIELGNPQNITYDFCRLNLDKMPVYCQYYTNDTIFAHHLSPAGYLFEYHPKRVALSDSDIKMQKEKG
ncbi:MAG: DUF2723 domain-containing protein [Candidatus Zixiibacteriota bacterium]